MATTLAVFSKSQVDAIKAYLNALDVTNGMFIQQIQDEIYIFDW